MPLPVQPGGCYTLSAIMLTNRLSIRTGVYGKVQMRDALHTGDKPVMLVSSDPGCGPCTALLPEIARWQREHATRMSIASISQGPAEAR